MLHARKDYTTRIIDTAGLIPDDEPVFLIRAQDVLAPGILVEWLGRYQELSDHDPLVAASVRAHVGRMDRWQRRFGTKTPDYPDTEFVEAESVLPPVESGVPDISSALPESEPEDAESELVKQDDEEAAQFETELAEKVDKLKEELIARGKELYEESFARAIVSVSIQWEALPSAAQRQWVEKARAEQVKKFAEDHERAGGDPD